MLKYSVGSYLITRLYNFTNTYYTAIAHIRFVRCSRAGLSRNKSVFVNLRKEVVYTKLWEENMLINGTSAARRPKVGGVSKLSAAWCNRRRALLQDKQRHNKWGCEESVRNSCERHWTPKPTCRVVHPQWGGDVVSRCGVVGSTHAFGSICHGFESKLVPLIFTS